MEIQFRISVENVKSLLEQEIQAPDVGFDDWAEATLWLDDDSTDENGSAKWYTAFSGYVYEIRWFYNHDYDRRLHVKYIGAERGFLAQNLLPKFLREGEIEITTASGSHGDFHGSDALERYIETKATHRKWVAENIMIPASTNRWEEIAAIAAALAARDKYRSWDKSEIKLSYQVGEKTFSSKGEACLEGYRTGKEVVETASRVIAYEGEIENESRCFDNETYNEIWRSRLSAKYTKA